MLAKPQTTECNGPSRIRALGGLYDGHTFVLDRKENLLGPESRSNTGRSPKIAQVGPYFMLSKDGLQCTTISYSCRKESIRVFKYELLALFALMLLGNAARSGPRVLQAALASLGTPYPNSGASNSCGKQRITRLPMIFVSRPHRTH